MARTKLFNEDEVLDKAVCLFLHKGYNGTSMQDLVDGLGISRSSLYDTYVDKHTLYVKALERYQAAGGNKICNIVSEDTPAKEKISHLLKLYTGNLLNDAPQKGCFLVSAELEMAPHDPLINEMIYKNEQVLEDAFLRAIQKGQQSGEISTKMDAQTLTRFFLTTGKGLRVSTQEMDPAFFENIIQTALLVLN